MNRNSKDELRARLLSIFREEAADHLRAIVSGMAELEGVGDPVQALGPVERMFRTVHTLKGAARSLSIHTVEQLCHQIEDLCADLVQRRAVFDDEAHAQLHELTSRLDGVVKRALAASAQPPSPPPSPPLSSPPSSPPTARPSAPPPSSSPAPPALSAAPADPPPPASPAAVSVVPSPLPPPAFASAAPGPEASPAYRPPPRPAAPDTAPSFVRVEAQQLRRLGLMAEQLLAPKLAAGARAEQAKAILADIAFARALHASEGRAGDGARSTVEDLRALEQAVRQLSSGLMEDHRVLRTLTDELALALREARMMPAREMLTVFPAMVADLAREVEKDVRWHTSGADLLVDRQVAELLKDPLIHLVRNAIDHGIETPQGRVATGKPPRGTVSLAIEPAEGGRVAIEVADDGAGIDIPAVRAAAVRNRLLSEHEAHAMPDTDVVDLVFQASLSTRGVISSMSGRGLGLSIVRERAERLGGSVLLRSMLGSGTAVRLEVPAALANFRGIGVRVADQAFIWPRDAVERTVCLSAEACEAAAARGGLQLDGGLVPFAHLGQLLGLAFPEPAARTVSCVLVRHGGRRGVVAVEEVTGDCEVVVKELRPPLLRVRHVLAAGLTGTGRLALILRPADLVEALATRPKGRVAAPRPVRRASRSRLLIVDDSLTTRSMEVGLLEAAGYEVEAAADGVEAWAALQRQDFDAVVSDVDMPNMDGFALTEKIRSDPRLKQLPIVLVTALERREDHDRGLRLGANAYMMKSDFDQSMLIDLVRRVL